MMEWKLGYGKVIKEGIVGQPVINRIEPTSGPVGTLVRIFGQNFGKGGIVSFNGVVAFDSVQASADAATAEADRKADEAEAAQTKAAQGKKDATGVKAITGTTAASATTGKTPTKAEQDALDKAATEKAGATAPGNVGPRGHSDPAAEAEMTAQVTGGAEQPKWHVDEISAHVPEGATTGDVLVIVDGQLSNGSAFKVIPAL